MTYKQHAKNEFIALGWMDNNGLFCDEMQELICNQILELLGVFASHGHSGSSAPYAIDMFAKLAKFEPLGAVTGDDSEWSEVGEGVFQNKRCGRVFKQADRFNGQAYDVKAIVFWEWRTDEDGSKYKLHYTSKGSQQPVTFPYTPKTEYKEVITNTTRGE